MNEIKASLEFAASRPAHDPAAKLMQPEVESEIETAFNDVSRQLEKIDAALTLLQVASAQKATTTLMLEHFNVELSVLDERLKCLATVAIDDDRWTHRPVAAAYGRLRRLVEQGIACGHDVAQGTGDLREFLAQFRRLAKRLVVHWDKSQKARDENTHAADLSGRKLGEFILRGRIAEGAFGAVYSCEQPLLGREAVVKVLHGKQRRSDVVVRRFLREAWLASRLDHPYTVHVYAFGVEEEDRLLWIAMERVHGVTLAEWLVTHGPMPLEQLVPLFERIAAVVQTAHDRGIVHRDLKPSNVMVIERAGELLPKLLDFGVATLLNETVLPEGIPVIDYPPLPVTDDTISPVCVVREPDQSTMTGDSSVPQDDDGRLTQNNHAVGSPPYMSPEQWNSATVGPAADLYALAIVAFETLTGRRPFQAATMAEYTELHCHGEVPTLGHGFPVALDRVFRRALAKRPEDRWATALELASALRAVARDRQRIHRSRRS